MTPTFEGPMMKSAVALALLLAAPALSAQAPRAAAPATLIRNATVLTVTKGTLAGTDVLLQNGSGRLAALLYGALPEAASASPRSSRG